VSNEVKALGQFASPAGVFTFTIIRSTPDSPKKHAKLYPLLKYNC